MVLGSSDRAQVLAIMRRHANSAVHRRMYALVLLDESWTAERVAEPLLNVAETVGADLRRCAAQGRPGIEQLGHLGHAPLLSAT
jgi:4-diphosphocytidyl-2C-methyl-D-erythritol kinase